MTSNTRSSSAARGLIPLSILAALLFIILVAYLNLKPVPMAGNGDVNVSASVSEIESDSAADTNEAVADTDSESDSADANSAEDRENTDDTEAAEESNSDSEETVDASNDSGEEGSGETGSDESNSDESSPQDAADSNETDSENSETGSAADVVVGTYNNMPVGYTADGLVFRGEPDAPVTIYEYSDYQCPFCLRHFSQTESALNEAYVETGKAKFVFVDFPLVQLHPNAPAASASALCIAEQDPVAFWEAHALIFETQNEWSNSPEPEAYFQELVAQLEIDQDAYADCVDSGRADAMIERSYAMGRSLGFSGTPSFQFAMADSDETYNLIGAQPYEKFSNWIDAMAEGEVPADAVQQPDDTAQQQPQELPFWATEEGLSPDPDREGFTMAGDAYRGDVDAPIVIIEYSDYQCPFCRRHTENTQPILDEQFVDTGQVRWVFRHFPLNIHPQAPAAGVAAECAGEQGQFWEMHEILFGDVQAWSISEPNPRFIELATQLALDIEAFEACLTDETIMARIESDFADGRPFVQGTPTFIVMSDGQGRLIPGALPADTFTEAIQQIIDSAQ